MESCRMPGAVYAGAGAMEQLEALCRGARRVAVFTDRGVERSGALEGPMKALERSGAEYALLRDLPSEPTVAQAQAVADAFAALGADCVVAVGGGSVMDVAKLCSIIGEGGVQALLDAPLSGRRTVRSVMIPTTAGTGAEATPNAIVAVPEKALKVGVVNPAMIPDAVILDGALLRGLPTAVAASTGVDALCHAIECYTSRKATAFSDLFALEALRLIFAHLERACTEPDATENKTAMLRAAFYAGVAIACSGTTAVHALSYPLGGRFHIAHGVANAMLLTPVMRFNAPACVPELARVYGALGMEGVADEAARADAVLARMEGLVARLSIPTDLRVYGVTADDLDALVAAGMDVQRLLQNNKRPVGAEDARAIYRSLLV